MRGVVLPVPPKAALRALGLADHAQLIVTSASFWCPELCAWRKAEIRWENANDDRGIAVQLNGLTDHARRRAEARGPQCVAEKDHARLRKWVLAIDEEATELRLDTAGFEEVLRDACYLAPSSVVPLMRTWALLFVKESSGGGV